MNLRLDGKEAVVCGASRGIGLACAQALAQLGASITLAGRNPAALDAAKATLVAQGNQEHGTLIADFSVPNQLAKAVDTFVNTGARAEILINNTGGPPPGLAIDASAEAYLAAFNLHLISNHTIATRLTPHMRSVGYGRIVNIVSTSVKSPLPNLGVSNTVRGAVASWAKTLSTELAPDSVTVNNVLPGATATERLEQIIANKAKAMSLSEEDAAAKMRTQIPMGRFAAPEEIAAAVAFLASPAASYITGVSIAVDGGRTNVL